jgi:hypothetical protein
MNMRNIASNGEDYKKLINYYKRNSAFKDIISINIREQFKIYYN